jgi:hypothetical protein
MDETRIVCKSQIIKYKLSHDKKGLLAYFDGTSFYHIHSDELTMLEEWIRKLLLKLLKIKSSGRRNGKGKRI